MKILLVTEKCAPHPHQHDGGARLVETLQRVFKNQMSILQFGGQHGDSADWQLDYPVYSDNRFERRLANAEFIAHQVKAMAPRFTHILFVHLSMQFGFSTITLPSHIKTWTFPMFLTPSYVQAGETVPLQYTNMEHSTLASSQNIVTPSYFEKQQLLDYYGVPASKIQVVPRGVTLAQLCPMVRSIKANAPTVFCALGSIKPQKNTLGLIELFAALKIKLPKANLRIIGPVQNQAYYQRVLKRIAELKLDHSIAFTGPIAPAALGAAMADCHIHLSMSQCETFGRAIFETLACGMPSVALHQNNAAAEFLQDLPYIQFVHDQQQALTAVDSILGKFETLSEMALEIGHLYNDNLLAHLLAAKICDAETIGISDYDGTLFHKNYPEKTLACMTAFKKFRKKIICSARSTQDLLAELRHHQLQVDWILSYSGAVATTGQGDVLWIQALCPHEVQKLEALCPDHEKILVNDAVIQIASNTIIAPDEFHREIYQGKSFFSSWKTSKLRSICRLLQDIKWRGNVKAWGDGPYDREFLTYFDGEWVKP